MTDADLERAAQAYAQALTDAMPVHGPDRRVELLMATARALDARTQFYTAKLIRYVARLYQG